jgi:membrane associated rhomboid family serine protease
MVFPVGTDNDSRRYSPPFVTYLLIAANVAVFLAEMNLGEGFVKQWAFTPAAFFAAPGTHFATVFTSMFLHGGMLHIIGNMAYLWSFGDNVEDNFGHLPFLLFYLIAGLIATLAQGAFAPHSALPTVGASGAIAGVLGAYILMFPKGTVTLLTNRGVINLPAFIAIGGWILLQFVSVAGEFAKTTGDTGGVAYMAHIGGFFAGLLLAFVFRTRSQETA